MELTLPLTKIRRNCEDVCKDRISKLPDEILVLILSYLKTKEAVATSVLSKRWEHLWTLTSDFEISDHSLVIYEEQNHFDSIIKYWSFKYYVDKFIFYHCGSKLRKCSLNFQSKYVAPNIYSWICGVICCNVEELRVVYVCHSESISPAVLPCRIFTCKTLVALKIYGHFVLDIPTYVLLPCLKILTIIYPMFVDDASTERLFSSCPVLEELNIFRLKDCLEIMNISNPSLKILRIYSTAHRIQVVINTPCLEYLKISGYSPSSYIVNFPSSIVRAHLDSGIDISLLKGISQVNLLVLRGSSQSFHNVIRSSGSPTFRKLVTMKYRVGGLADWTLLPNLLHWSPNLKVLTIETLSGYKQVNIDADQINWQQPESVPECVELHLKKIEIMQFMGFREELRLVEYMLESAKVLEQMIIHMDKFRRDLSVEKKKEADEVMHEVLSYKRGCSSCVVTFAD